MDPHPERLADRIRAGEAAFAAHDVQAMATAFSIASALVDKRTLTEEVERRYADLGVRLRDLGQPEAALGGFTVAFGVVATPRLASEILIILVHSIRDKPRIKAFIESLPPELETDPVVSLLLARGYFLIGDLVTAAGRLARTDMSSIGLNPFFMQLHVDTHAEILWALGDVVTSLGGDPLGGGLVPALREASIARGLRDLQPEAFDAALRRLVFVGQPHERHDPALVARAVAGMTGATAIQNMPIALRLLVSLCETALAVRLADALAETPARLDPDYIKSLVRLGEQTGEARWEEQARRLSALSVEAGRQTWDNPKNQVRALEVAARHGKAEGLEPGQPGLLPRTPTSGLPAGEGRHLFIGLFGQLRYQQQNLPRLARHLIGQAERFKAAGGIVSTGLSTWETSGQRPLLDHNPLVFLLEVLPQALGPALQATGVPTLGAAKAHLPNTIAKILSQSAAEEAITDAYLTNLLGFEMPANIGQTDAFMSSDGAALRRVCGNDDHYVNQGKMWNRLAGLRPLIERAERETGAPVTHAVLVRNDLNFLSEAIGARLDELVGEARANVAYTDQDVHAHYIEGLGDRYILCDRPALDRILDGNRLMQLAAEGRGISPEYIKRFTAHEFLGSILFEHAAKVRTVAPWEVPIEIYRGRRGKDELREELLADAAGACPAPLKQAIAELFQEQRNPA